MSKVYVLTEGSYSDYGIEGVFATKEGAEAYIRRFPGLHRDYDIEEYELDYLANCDEAANAEKILNGRSRYCVTMRMDGTVLSVDDITSTDTDEVNSFDLYRDTDRETGEISQYIRGYFYANDKEHAVKILNEKRALVIAENLAGYN